MRSPIPRRSSVAAPPLRRAPRARCVAALLLTLVAACATGERARVQDANDPAPPPAARAADATPGHGAPAGWRTASAPAFERLAAAIPAGDGPHRFTDAALDDFRAALDAQDVTSVRAAVLCARSRDPRAADLLLERLERRAFGPERNSDAGDVVAAAALADRTEIADAAGRLVALAAGPRPHPDLEVRVECAASALRLGAPTASVAPFLLTVLRAMTPAEREHPGDWPRQETVAWCKTRAAAALSERAGVPNPHRPDASFDDQEAATRALERALGIAAE